MRGCLQVIDMSPCSVWHNSENRNYSDKTLQYHQGIQMILSEEIKVTNYLSILLR